MINRASLIAVVLLCAVASAGSAISVAAQQSFVPVTPAIQENPDPSDWLHISRTYNAHRYSPLNQINASNVGKLQVAWMFSTGVLRGHEGSPLVIGDTMYLVTPFPNNVFSTVDADTVTGRRLALSSDLMPVGGGYVPDPSSHNMSDGFSPSSTLLAHFPGGTVTGLPTPITIDASLAALSGFRGRSRRLEELAELVRTRDR